MFTVKCLEGQPSRGLLRPRRWQLAPPRLKRSVSPSIVRHGSTR